MMAALFNVHINRLRVRALQAMRAGYTKGARGVTLEFVERILAFSCVGELVKFVEKVGLSVNAEVRAPPPPPVLH